MHMLCRCTHMRPSRVHMHANLLNSGALMEGYNGRTACHAAAVFGKSAGLKILIERGANVNMASEGPAYPLMEAASANHLLCAQLLLAAGANVHQRDHNDLNALAVAKTPEMFRLLLDAVSVLIHAFFSMILPIELHAFRVRSVSLRCTCPDVSSLGVCSCPRKQGADATFHNREGSSLLHTAVAKEWSASIICLLLKNGAGQFLYYFALV